ncbi:hypothetical protein NDU88_007716 [Pleurodeles waltl]|uniref:Uncharacterized protein n=1 Tax=Pleurodeles waltl TaxID=8319 RepID=A0AAV7N517_PLEWA|nr:hypothetical protein NDU88_007716 [Pleurodeles waltl]
MGLRAIPTNALVNLSDDMVLDYCKGRADVVHSVSHQVGTITASPQQEQCHDFSPGNWVLVKKHARKTCLERHWCGPHQVIRCEVWRSLKQDPHFPHSQGGVSPLCDSACPRRARNM